MDHTGLLRQMVAENRAFFEGTMEGVTQEQALWAPGGTALPIVAHYAHVITAQDFGLHALVRRSTPLALDAWGGRSGMTEPPPPFGHPWTEWGRQPFDIEALRSYAQAVYETADAYFMTLDAAEIARPIDLTDAGFGMQTVGFLLLNGWVTNVSLHTGEISCLKGLLGEAGYPV